MRTALFNWLWARHNNGQFILRIDDTDQQRNVGEALAPILQAFRWLGLDWDEGPEVGGDYGPYFQSERNDLYQNAAAALLSAGLAYRDFDPPELVQQDRQAAEKEKRNYLNIRRSLDLTDAQRQQYLEEGRPFVVRFLVPRSETVVLDDEIRGHVEWDCSLIPDPVIQRGNGTPLYNFATVVDDAQMHISHVIRAEEHLSNTPIQILLHKALGHDLPRFAHIPYVSAPGTKEKLSKREKSLAKYARNPQFQKMFQAADRVFPRIGLGSSASLNPVMVEYYEKLGYLPAGVLNALARLGWSLDDKTEILSLETVVENFTLDRVIKSPAGLDPAKLDSYQAHWMSQLSLEEKVAGCLPFLVQAKLISSEPDESTRMFVQKLVEILEDRIRIFSDILDYDEYFVADEDLTYDEKAFKKRLVNAPQSVELLKAYRDQLANVEPFDAPTTEASLKEFVESQDAKLGDVIHALRVAVTGKPKGPGMFDCLELLGREKTLARINRALNRVEENRNVS
ncbi:MAG: glutamate--tRNA ligase [Planctomycetaceae bacterium]